MPKSISDTGNLYHVAYADLIERYMFVLSSSDVFSVVDLLECRMSVGGIEFPNLRWVVVSLRLRSVNKTA